MVTGFRWKGGPGPGRAEARGHATREVPTRPKLLLAAAYTSVETRNEAAFYRSVLRSRHKDLTSGSTR